VNGPDEDLIDIHWESTTEWRVRIPRSKVKALLGHTAAELGHQPIIDAQLFPGEPGMDASRHELAEALGALEVGAARDKGVCMRVITWVSPDL
jgi:hypothetical protein